MQVAELFPIVQVLAASILEYLIVWEAVAKQPSWYHSVTQGVVSGQAEKSKDGD